MKKAHKAVFQFCYSKAVLIERLSVIKDYKVRDENGKIVYRTGFSGGTDKREDDISTKKPKNEAEAACFNVLQGNGWKPTKRGWPDYFCIRGNEICAVEVKPRKSDRLKRNQLVVMGLLAKQGMKCFMWSPDGGFEAVTFED